MSIGDVNINEIARASLPGNPAGTLLEGTSFALTSVDAPPGEINAASSARVFRGVAEIQVVPVPEPEGSVALDIGLLALSVLDRSRRRS